MKINYEQKHRQISYLVSLKHHSSSWVEHIIRVANNVIDMLHSFLFGCQKYHIVYCSVRCDFQNANAHTQLSYF